MISYCAYYSRGFSENCWNFFGKDENQTKIDHSKQIQIFGIFFYHSPHPEGENPDITKELAVWYAMGILVMTAINAIIINQFFILGFHNGMKIRVAMCSLIYRKVSAILAFDWFICPNCHTVIVLLHRFY